jgi:hypothetical protein
MSDRDDRIPLTLAYAGQVPPAAQAGSSREADGRAFGVSYDLRYAQAGARVELADVFQPFFAVRMR